MSDETFLERFEDCAWPPDQWHHREHLKVAYLYLRRYGFDEALSRIRAGIQALNAAHKVPDALTRGYHETMTQAWLRLVHAAIEQHDPAGTADQFLDAHASLLQMSTLRAHYSHDRLMSPAAKRQFVEPDLAPLPDIKFPP